MAAAFSEFELIPAIDLKDGKCVRLEEGQVSRATEYSDDPLAVALHWQELGALRLHLVDLDGAFSGGGRHVGIAASIFGALNIPVQFGGGLRTIDEIARVIELGADRVVLGTVAVEEPRVVEAAVRRWPGAVVIAIDARMGKVALRGWVDPSGVRALDLARRVSEMGVERVVYTDISRDGLLRGVNVDETEALAQATGLKVIASGGVAGIEDVQALWSRRRSGIEGVILGRALYERKIDLRELVSALNLWGEDAG